MKNRKEMKKNLLHIYSDLTALHESLKGNADYVIREETKKENPDYFLISVETHNVGLVDSAIQETNNTIELLTK